MRGSYGREILRSNEQAAAHWRLLKARDEIEVASARIENARHMLSLGSAPQVALTHIELAQQEVGRASVAVRRALGELVPEAPAPAPVEPA